MATHTSVVTADPPVGTSLISTEGLRQEEVHLDAAAGDRVGTSLISTEGLRRFSFSVSCSIERYCRNFPDQHGGIATLRSAPVERRSRRVGTSLISTEGLRPGLRLVGMEHGVPSDFPDQHGGIATQELSDVFPGFPASRNFPDQHGGIATFSCFGARSHMLHTTSRNSPGQRGIAASKAGVRPARRSTSSELP